MHIRAYQQVFPELSINLPSSALRQFSDNASNDWWTNPDGNCGGSCNANGYLWLGLTALGGAYEDRCSDLVSSWGWPYCTLDELQVHDANLYALVTNSQYNLPSCYPNGTYGDDPTSCGAMASCAAGFALLAAFILNV